MPFTNFWEHLSIDSIAAEPREKEIEQGMSLFTAFPSHVWKTFSPPFPQVPLSIPCTQLAKPSVSLPSKYAFGTSENVSVADALETWTAVTGKQAEYGEVSAERYEDCFIETWG